MRHSKHVSVHSCSRGKRKIQIGAAGLSPALQDSMESVFGTLHGFFSKCHFFSICSKACFQPSSLQNSSWHLQMNLDTLLKLLEGHQKNSWPLELDIDLSWYFSCFFSLINPSKKPAIDSFLFSAKHRLGSLWWKNISSEIFWLYFQTAKSLLAPFCNYYAFFTCQREHWNERDALLLANLISFPHCFFPVA